DAGSGFDWNSINDESANLSLFSNKRLIELRLGSQSPGKDGSRVLVEYAGQPAADYVLVITSGKIDKRSQQSRWFKALDKGGVTIQVWPLAPAQLPGWVRHRMQRYGKQISTEAASLIAERVEGNLLAASQELDKLSLLVENKNIDLDDVLAVVTDSTHYDVFSLIEDALCGHIDRTTRMLHSLQKEGFEPIAIFGALMWEFRRVCSMSYQIESGIPRDKVFAENRVWEKRKKAITTVLNRHDSHALQTFLKKAVYIDKVLKGASKGNAWDELTWFLLGIADVQFRAIYIQ
ncbi:MAG: DNA polymerase III subunit delta, partial [Gammaproteobacteria bacterium]